MKAVDEIRMVPTGHRNGMGDVPTDAIEIKSVKRATKEEVDAMIAAEKAPAAPAETPK